MQHALRLGRTRHNRDRAPLALLLGPVLLPLLGCGGDRPLRAPDGGPPAADARAPATTLDGGPAPGPDGAPATGSAPVTDGAPVARGDAGPGLDAPRLSGSWTPCGALTPGGAAPAHKGPVWAVAVSRDGKTVATSGHPDEHKVHVWSLATRARLQTVAGAELTLSVDLAPDGSKVATTGDGTGIYALPDGRRLWDIPPPPEVPAEGGWESGLAFSPDGAAVAFAGYGRIELRAVGNGALVAELDRPARARAVAFSPDGAHVATSAGELWTIADRGRRWAVPDVVPRTTGPILVDGWVAFAPDGRRIVVSHCAFRDGNLTRCQSSAHLLRAEDGQTERILGDVTLPRRPTFSPDGRWLVAGDRLIPLDGGAPQRLPVPAVVSTFAPDGTIVAGDASGAVQLLCPR